MNTYRIAALTLFLVAVSAAVSAEGYTAPKFLESKVELKKPPIADLEWFYPEPGWTQTKPFDRSSPENLAVAYIYVGTYWGGLVAEVAGLEKRLDYLKRDIAEARIIRIVGKEYFETLSKADGDADGAFGISSVVGEPKISRTDLQDGSAQLTIAVPITFRVDGKSTESMDYRRIQCAKQPDGKWAVTAAESGYAAKDAEGKEIIKWSAEAPAIHTAYWNVFSENPPPSFDPSTGSAKACAEAYMFDLALELKIVRDRAQRAVLKGLIPLIGEIYAPEFIKSAQETAAKRGTWEERLRRYYKPRTAKKEEDVAGGKRFVFETASLSSVALTVTKGESGWRVTLIESYEEKVEKQGAEIVTTPIYTPIKKWSQTSNLGLH